MDISELIKSYNAEQKNVFTGFCIQLPLIFTVLYLYIPAFKDLDIYLQVIFSASSSILSIYYSFALLLVASILSKIRYKLEILILIIPMLSSTFHLIRFTDNYSLGYEYAISTYLKYSALTFCPIAIYGFVMRKCKEYDIKRKRDNISKIK